MPTVKLSAIQSRRIDGPQIQLFPTSYNIVLTGYTINECYRMLVMGGNSGYKCGFIKCHKMNLPGRVLDLGLQYKQPIELRSQKQWGKL